MNKNKHLIALIPTIVVCCGWGLVSYSREQFKPVQEKINNHEITFSGGDGSSFENAIIISGAINDIENIISEEIYINSKYGIKGKYWKMLSQYYQKNQGKKYDFTEIKLFNDNEIKSFYFDVSELENRNQELKRQMLLSEIKNIQNKIDSKEINFSENDGTTIENAVKIIGAKTDKESVISEQIYLHNKYGVKGNDWQMLSQANLIKNGINYDLIEIINLKSNKKESYYFDISCCFGKY